MLLEWRTITHSNDPKHLVKGTELEVAFPHGFRHRFAIYSVRTSAPQYKDGRYTHTEHDARYRVRDAEAAGDAHFREGGRAPIFCECATLDEALAKIEPHRPPLEDAA